MEALEKKDKLMDAQLRSLERTNELLLSRVETMLSMHARNRTTAAQERQAPLRGWFSLW